MPFHPRGRAIVRIGDVDVSDQVTDIRVERRLSDDPLLDLSGRPIRVPGQESYEVTIEVTEALAQAVTEAVRQLAQRRQLNYYTSDFWEQSGTIPRMQCTLDEVPPPSPVPTAEPVHPFSQDPAERARLCSECGMWPEHHGHGRGSCVCTDCVPDADDLEDYSIYSEEGFSGDRMISGAGQPRYRWAAEEEPPGDWSPRPPWVAERAATGADSQMPPTVGEATRIFQAAERARGELDRLTAERAATEEESTHVFGVVERGLVRQPWPWEART